MVGHTEKEYAQNRKPYQLEKNVLYEKTNFKKLVPDGDKIKYPGIVVYFLDEGIKFYTYLPSMHHKMSEAKVEAYNAAIKEGKPPTMCYYGQMGRTSRIEIHDHGIVDQVLLANIERIGKLLSASPSSSPSKRPRSPDSDCGNSPSAKRQASDLRE